MPNAFISYRRKPSSSLAHLLQNDLQSRYGFDIYLDTTRSDSAKVQFPERLLSAIDASDVFICLLADTTLESEWVLREIQRAFDGKKPCIPVFQESYQPRAIDNAAVDYLLSFDGVHVLDERGLYIDESVQKIAALIPHEPHRTALYLVPIVLLLVVGLIATIVLLNNGNDDNRERTTSSHEAAAQATSDTPDPTTTNTLSVDEKAQATANAVSTLNEDYRRATATEQAVRDNYDITTALPLTQAAQDTLDAIAVQTRVAALQTTLLPTPTNTPSNTSTATSTKTFTPSATSTSTPSLTAKPSSTSTLTLTVNPTYTATQGVINTSTDVSSEGETDKRYPCYTSIIDSNVTSFNVIHARPARNAPLVRPAIPSETILVEEVNTSLGEIWYKISYNGLVSTGWIQLEYITQTDKCP